jgi:hypothetical protein
MSEGTEKKPARVRIGGLWANESGSVMSGNVGGMRLVIFPNSYRGDNPKAPTHVAYWEELPPKEDGGGKKSGW